MYSKKKLVKRNHKCNICGKEFEEEEYLEFHMKQNHYRGEKLQDRYNQRGMLCPAELCDIFECPDLADSRLKVSVFKDRSDKIFEDRHSSSYKKKSRSRDRNGGIIDEGPSPIRYEMIQKYDVGRRASLLQKCHRTFLDCVDYKNTATNKDNVLKAFDFFSQIYCQKFEVGALEDKAEER